jgi:hypothetical protein
LTYLDKNQIHSVDVLSGAFMLLRRSALDKTGLLDEDFFMYGEDIDLSYRITKAGYKNYYFPETRIIHYKGESTKKSSVNYVLVFYKAMVIFARKHFSSGHAALFSLLINLAVWIRAGAALLYRFLNRILLPACDALLFFTGMVFLKNYWETSVKALNYPPFFVNVVIPLYVLIWITGIYLSGGYDKPVRQVKILRGILSGTVFILVVYALLPESLRFSRALILIGTFWTGFSALLLRHVLFYAGFRSLGLYQQQRKRIIIAANEEEGARILSMLNLSGAPFTLIGFARPDVSPDDPYAIGKVSQLPEAVKIYNADEIIFSSGDLSSSEIMKLMQEELPGNVEFKIAPPESLFIIGSNSIDEQGNFYMVDINALSDPANRRKKKIFDIITSAIVLILSPLLLILLKDAAFKISAAWQVLTGKKTWIGIPVKSGKKSFLKEGVYSPAGIFSNRQLDDATINRIYVLYLKEYDVMNDLKILWHHLKK